MTIHDLILGIVLMYSFLEKLNSDDSGATAIEYALIATLVVVTIIGALNLLSTDLNNTFNTVANTVTPVI